MKEPIGYNDDRFSDLPDADASWEKMKQLLDDDDRRRRVIPFWLRWAGLGVLFAGVMAAGWFFLAKDPDGGAATSSEKETVSYNKTNPATENNSNSVEQKEQTKQTTNSGDTEVNEKNSDASNTVGKKEDLNVSAKEANPRSITTDHQNESVTQQMPHQKQTSSLTPATKPKAQKPSIRKKSNPMLTSKRRVDDPLPKDVRTKKNLSSTDPKPSTDEVIDAPKTSTDLPPVGKPASLDSSSKSPVKKPVKAADTAVKKAIADANTVIDTAAVLMADSKKPLMKKKLKWTIGLSLQEPLAIGSQQASAYTYTGKRNWAADHIPGLFITAGRSKWFAAAGFNYGVPQPVQAIYFSQATKYDASSYTAEVQKYQVEKMYYHQLALSANYLFSRKMSIGAGGSYQLLAGAVTQSELQTSNVITGSSNTVSKLAPVKGFKDSFLYKTTAAAFLNAEYHWNRITLGARYSYSLQPFIKYTRPDGEVLERKNNSLYMIVRIRLWEN
jgi:hypothetical protein